MPDDSQRFDEDSEFIPLDREDPSFGMWKQRRDASGDPKREPGPIQLQRFDSGLPYIGIPLVRRLCAEHKVVGIEVVELLPYLDPTYRSALMANRCIREMLTGLAMYKKGMRSPHYLDPFTSGAER